VVTHRLQNIEYLIVGQRELNFNTVVCCSVKSLAITPEVNNAVVYQVYKIKLIGNQYRTRYCSSK